MIELSFEWLPGDPDGSPCSTCNTGIYTTKWTEHLVTGNKKTPTKEGAMCQSCYAIYLKEKDFDDNFGHLGLF